ncbi:unnamed protein product, partial [Phaeothamnion confervicola]
MRSYQPARRKFSLNNAYASCGNACNRTFVEQAAQTQAREEWATLTVDDEAQRKKVAAVLMRCVWTSDKLPHCSNRLAWKRGAVTTMAQAVDSDAADNSMEGRRPRAREGTIGRDGGKDECRSVDGGKFALRVAVGGIFECFNKKNKG